MSAVLLKRIWIGFLLSLGFILTIESLVSANTISPKIQIPEREFNFQTAKIREVVEHSFFIKNQSQKKLFFEKVDMIGPLDTIKMPKVIAPGQEGTVVLTLDTSQAIENVEAKAILFPADPSFPQIVLKMTGRIKAPPIQFNPFPAVFLAAFTGDEKATSLEIINNEKEPLEILGIEHESKRFQANVQTVTKGKEFKLIVKNNPYAVPGKTSETLILITNFPEFSEIKLPVNIYIKRDVFAFPETLELGKLNIMHLRKQQTKSADFIKQLTQFLVIKRKPGKGKDFQINTEHDIPFIKVKKEPESNSETYKLEITPILEKMKPGKIDTFIKVKTNDKEVPELKIPVVGEVL